MIKVVIVILNWKRADDTIECLKSVEKLNTKDIKLQTVIVDNDSQDGSVEKINKFIKNTSHYSLVTSHSNLGYAEGNNVGIRHAKKQKADFVMVLNNDTILDKNLLQGFVSAAHRYPEAAVFSPKIYFAKGFEFHKKRYKKDQLGKVIWYAGGMIDWHNVYAQNRGLDDVDSGQYDKDLILEFATGTCLFIRSQVFDKVGLFDKRYFMYLEDADLSQRIINHNWKIQYYPKAFLWHKVAQSSRVGSDLNDYFLTRNRMLFGMKYAGLRAKFALLRESTRFLINGRKWQKIGIKDYYIGRFGKGPW